MERVIAALAAGCALLALSACDGSSPSSPTRTADWVDFNQKLIKSRLHDPRRATFGKAFVAKAEGLTVRCVCGEFEPGAGDGAGAGHQRFISCGSGAQMLEAEVAPAAMDKTWADVCLGANAKQPVYAAGAEGAVGGSQDR